MKNDKLLISTPASNTQIEELATEIYELFRSHTMSRALAHRLYDKGYRKQSEGEWLKSQFAARTGFYTIKDFVCSECRIYVSALESSFPMDYCPHCGAKMKGGN